jgi:hypothetical protein
VWLFELAGCETKPTTPVLWAWEAPQELEGLPIGVEVAFLASTLSDVAGKVVAVPRKQSLKTSPYTPLTAVVRLEFAGMPPVEEVLKALKPTSTLPRISRLQLDADIRLSQREWYRSLIVALAAQSTLPLSITALASWCLQDPWLAGLPVAEVVPMFFDLGQDKASIQRFLDQGGRLQPECEAWGVLDLEPILPEKPTRLYIFHKGSWDNSSIQKALQLSSKEEAYSPKR